MPVPRAVVLPVAALVVVCCIISSCLTQVKDAEGNNVGWKVLGAMAVLLAVPAVLVCCIAIPSKKAV